MLFSVVVPVRNKGPHLPRAIGSALRQSFADFELLAVDDASSDGGPAYLRSLSDTRLRLFRRDAPGPGGYAARNLAARHARGRWLAFLDADDEWRPDHLARMADAAALAPAGVGLIAARFEVRGGGPHPAMRGAPGGSEHGDPVILDRDGFLDLWLARGDCPVWTSALALRRDVCERIGGFPEGRARRGGDKDTWLRAAFAADVAFSPHVTAVYHRDSVAMVTRDNAPVGRHCVCATIDRLIASTDDLDRRRRLRRVLNREVWSAFRGALRRGRHAEVEIGDFFPREDPWRYAAMRALRALPPGMAYRRPATGLGRRPIR